MSVYKASQDLYKAYNDAFNNLGKPDNDGISFTGTDWYQSGIAAAGDNPDYLRLVTSNPYLNFTRHQTGWQKFLSNLGFNTNYDAYVQQMEQSAREYNSNVMANISENNYNSYEQDMARQRAAGYNPDLLGAQGIGQMSANESPNPTGTPEIESPGSQVTNFLDNVGNAINIGLSFFSSMQDIKAKSINVENLKLGNISALQSFSDDLISSAVDPNASPDVQARALNSFSDVNNILSFFPFLGRKQAKKLSKVYNNYSHSPKAEEEFWNRLSAKYKSRSDYSKQKNYFGGDDEIFSSVITDSIIKPLMDFQVKIDKLLYSNEEKQAIVDEGNLDVLTQTENLGDQARTSLSENKAVRATSENSYLEALANKELQSTYRKIIHNLSSDKSFVSQLLLLGFMFVSKFGISLPNISKSTSVGPKGTTISKSLSF